MSKQPEALRLADEFSSETAYDWLPGYRDDRYAEATAELRRLHAVNAELVEALRIHHEWSIRNQRGYSEHGKEAIAFWATAAAIKRATEDA